MIDRLEEKEEEVKRTTDAMTSEYATD